MNRVLLCGRILALAVVIAAIVSKSAQAATYTPPSTAGCKDPAVSQLFLPWGDASWYAMTPGETPDNFAGTGWTLTGGATIKTATLTDGRKGHVLDMPSGSKAVSPQMCIGEGEPDARTLIREVAGSLGSSVAFTPFDLTTDTQIPSMGLFPTGTAWSPSSLVAVLPIDLSGWHIMQFTYVVGGTGNDFQIYDFAVDPRMKW